MGPEHKDARIVSIFLQLAEGRILKRIKQEEQDHAFQILHAQAFVTGLV